MAGRKRDGSAEAALTFRLPRDLHERLKEAGAGGSVSEEMRNRLAASLVLQPAGDPKTAELMGDIGNVVRLVNRMYAPWHESPYSKAVVRSAVMALLDAAGPSGELAFDPWPGAPEDIGRALALTVLVK